MPNRERLAVRPARRVLTARWLGPCVVSLVLLALVAADIPVIHDHHTDETPGWYDEECPLDRAAACRTGLAPDDPAPAASRFVAGDRVVLPDPLLPGRAALRRSQARAPPLPS